MRLPLSWLLEYAAIALAPDDDEGLRDMSRRLTACGLEVESFDLFHDRPNSHWVDACSDPNNETMNRLLPERRKLVTLVLVRGGVRAPATLAAVRSPNS